MRNFAFVMECKVDLDLKALQKALLKIMDAFDAVCRAHNVRYYMACGTMLGAVRHKGFIPWDDDVDVYMPRPDYTEFKKHASEWLPENLKFVDSDSDPTFPHYYGKVEDLNTTLIERTYLGHYGGLWIDVFPIDGASDSGEERRRHRKRFRHWRHLQYFVYRDPWKHGRTLGGMYVWLLQKIYSREKVNRRLQEILTEQDFDKCGLLMPHSDRQKTFTKEVLGEVPTEYEFEGRKFWGVKDYDKYLTAIFGDYMTPPPEDKRVVHHNIVFCDLNMALSEYLKSIGKEQPRK